MKRKTVIKIVLDVIMTILLLLMYQKKVISLDFHEIGGLCLFGLFIIHKLLNGKWIVTVTRRLFDSKLPGKTRLSYWLDALLLVSFVLIILSGIMISEVLFQVPQAPDGKTMHYFFSALALVLVGAHIGLHWGYLSALWNRAVRLPRIIAKPLGALLLVALLGFGGYSLTKTNFLPWLAMPFDSSLLIEESGGHYNEETEAEPAAEADTADPEEEGHTGGGGGLRDGKGKGAIEKATVEGSEVALVIAQYLSIMALFAAATHVVGLLIVYRGKSVAARNH